MVRLWKSIVVYKSEMSFRKALVIVLKNKGWLVQPIEVGGINVGVPDLWMIKGKSMWVELKNTYQEVSNIYVIDFRPGQQSWLLQNHQHGGNSYVIISTKSWLLVHHFTKLLPNNIITNKQYTLCQMSNISDVLLR